MGCVQSYFKRAHNAGISPSSTQDSNNKVPEGEDSSRAEDGKKTPVSGTGAEEPQSNDTSYGVEATAVRTLAATTGTVAILGTTAKTKEDAEAEEKLANETVKVKEEIKEAVKASERVKEGNSIKTEDTEEGDFEKLPSTKENVAASQCREAENMVLVKTEEVEHIGEKIPNISEEYVQPIVPIEAGKVNIGNDAVSLVQTEGEKVASDTDKLFGTKTVIEDGDSNIQSNLEESNISNATTLSNRSAPDSGQNVEQEATTRKSVEGRPELLFSAEENVDAAQADDKLHIHKNGIPENDSSKYQQVLERETPTISISEAEHIPNDSDEEFTITVPPVKSVTEEYIETVVVNENTDFIAMEMKSAESATPLAQTSDEPNKIDNNNSKINNIIIEENIIDQSVIAPLCSLDEERKSEQIVEVVEEYKNEEIEDGEEDVSKSISSEQLKTNSISDFSLSETFNNAAVENNSSTQSPVDENAINKLDGSLKESVDCVVLEKQNSLKESREEKRLVSPTDKHNSISDDNVLLNKISIVDNETVEIVADAIVNHNSISDIQIGKEANDIRGENNLNIRLSCKESESATISKDNSDIKCTETMVLSEYSKAEVVSNSTPEEMRNGLEIDDKIVSAATKIQAGIRGFLTRQNLKGTKQHAMDRLTPELLECAKEEVEQICKKAIETTTSILEKKCREEDLDLPPPMPEDSEQYKAATTIQASFRGFQARQNLQKLAESDKEEAAPDFPAPPALDDDMLFGPVIADDDLPPPDFDALESSYSEELDVGDASADMLRHNLMPLIPEISEVSHGPCQTDSEATIDEEEATLDRPSEVSSLVEGGPTLGESPTLRNSDSGESSEGESSLSSAATKIQAGVRGFLVRRKLQHIRGGTNSTGGGVGGSMASSDRSIEEGRSVESAEEETEIARHCATPEEEQPDKAELVVQVNELRTKEEGDAATLIQSSLREYNARKQLIRGDALCSATTTPAASSVERVEQRVSGELHDMIALTPPNTCSSGGTESGTDVANSVRPSVGKDTTMVKRGSEQDGTEAENAAAKIQAGFRGYKVRKERKEQDVGASSSLNITRATSLEEQSATKIQAGVRGFLVRRRGKSQDPSPQIEDKK